MNDNIDLTELLEGCPKGTEFYSTLFGKVTFDEISYGRIIIYCVHLRRIVTFNKAGKYLMEISENNGTVYSSECLLFPSKDQRDWTKFERFWDKPIV